MKKTAILTTGHPPFDDRIYWKFAKTLSQNFEVAIFCSTQEVNLTSSNIIIKGFNSNLVSRKGKFNKLTNYLKEFKPNIIICAETSAIVSALRYKKKTGANCKIVTDITEWYPENVASKLAGIKKVLIYIFLFLSNIFLTNRVSAIIIGEKGKKRRYDFLAPFKKKIIIGYYPVLKYFEYETKHSSDDFTMGYAGVINFKRGIMTLLDVLILLKKKHPDKNIKLKITGKFEYENEEKIFKERLKNEDIKNVELLEWTDYDKIYKNLKGMDVCFDLRQLNFIYKNSLPIKFFEYLAAGKPVIYSKIKPLESMNIEEFGFLVNPGNKEEVVGAAEKYLTDGELLKKHSLNARKFIEDGNYWEVESKKLVEFLNSL